MPAFELGLSLTGTVSAGAYTGGVIDFLFEALEQWQMEKDRNRASHGEDYANWDTPWHDVVITGLSGASGGGVTNGLILNNIGKNFPHMSAPQADETIVTGNDFYDAWVQLLSIQKLLDTTDLEVPGSTLSSLLNGDALPSIAELILQPSKFGTQLERPYIDNNLFSIITVTNLRGIPYRLDFNDPLSNQSIYTRHTDYHLIELSRNGDSKYIDGYLLPMDTTNTLFTSGYEHLKTVCLATCAFPGVFRAQPISQKISNYQYRNIGNAWNLLQNNIDFNYLCSDGGILNTEPFELLHDRMLPAGQSYNPSNPENVVRAVILIAPLDTMDNSSENVNAYDTNGDIQKVDVLTILPDTVTAIRNEALTSAESILKAIDESYFSRYLLAPSRTSTATADDNLKPAITGTVLGNFAGFLSKDFRDHDYFLGRRNAQQFLRAHFTLPISCLSANPIFGPLDAVNRFPQFIYRDNNVDYFPIIPLCGTANEDTYFPVWPTRTDDNLDSIQGLLSDRIKMLIKKLQPSLDLQGILNLILTLGSQSIADAAAKDVINIIQNSLSNANL